MTANTSILLIPMGLVIRPVIIRAAFGGLGDLAEEAGRKDIVMINTVMTWKSRHAQVHHYRMKIHIM